MGKAGRPGVGSDIRWDTQPPSVHEIADTTQAADERVVSATWFAMRDDPSMRDMHPNDDRLCRVLREALDG